MTRTCAPEAAPEAATSELYPWRHSHDQDALHFLHVRKMKTPSCTEMLGQGVQLIPSEFELQAASNHSQSQQGHVLGRSVVDDDASGTVVDDQLLQNTSSLLKTTKTTEIQSIRHDASAHRPPRGRTRQRQRTMRKPQQRQQRCTRQRQRRRARSKGGCTHPPIRRFEASRGRPFVGAMRGRGQERGGAGAGGGEARTFYARNSLRAHSPRIARSSPSAAAGATLRQRQRELFLVRLPYSSRSGVGLARTCHARRGRSAAAYFYYASACRKRWAGPCTTCTCRRPSTPPSQGRESPAA